MLDIINVLRKELVRRNKDFEFHEVESLLQEWLDDETNIHILNESFEFLSIDLDFNTMMKRIYEVVAWYFDIEIGSTDHVNEISDA